MIDKKKLPLAAAPMPQPAKLSRAVPTDVSPQRRAQAAMFAPVTNHFAPDAALAKLVDHQNPGAGAIGPPSPLAAPPKGVLARMAPASADAIAYGSTPRPGETMPEALGRYTAGAAGMVTAVPEALARAGADVATGAYGAAKGLVRGLTGAPTVASTQAPAGLTTNGVAPAQPRLTQAARGNAGIATPPAAMQPAGRPGATNLPGSPIRAPDGSVVYDDAFAARNQSLLKRYEQQNVVQSGLPGPGVLQSMAGGGTPELGKLARAPQGFTSADRAQQLDDLDRLGAGYAQGQARDAAARATSSAANALQRGDKQGAAAATQLAQTASASAQGLAAPPRVSQLTRMDPADAARNAIEQQRVDMEQQQSRVSTDTQRLQLQQAQQMQDLTTKLISGTPEERTAAAASMAALQGTKPGAPIRVKRQIDTGQKDVSGNPVLADQEVLYDPRSGQWIQPPAAGTATKQLPQGVTAQQAQADARAAIAAGASEEAVRQQMASYGLTL